jgi:hypothetical protein
VKIDYLAFDLAIKHVSGMSVWFEDVPLFPHQSIELIVNQPSDEIVFVLGLIDVSQDLC